MSTRRPRLIAIAGGSGAGKSWLAEQLQARLGKEATRLSQDDFYRDLSHLPVGQRTRINFDHPRAIDWELLDHVLTAALEGAAVRIPKYDFSQHTRAAHPEMWRPKPVIIMDGLWLLRRPFVRRHCSLGIFIDCPECVRYERRLARDLASRGRTEQAVKEQFARSVAPMHQRYIEPQRRRADIVLPGLVTLQEVDALAEKIRKLSRE